MIPGGYVQWMLSMMGKFFAHIVLGFNSTHSLYYSLHSVKLTALGFTLQNANKGLVRRLYPTQGT
jgi:hypothetical protein